MVTGSKQKIVGIAEDKWLLSASYYDDKYREIQSVRQLYPEGLELIYRKFNYQGNLTRVKELQTIDGIQEGFDRSYTYNIQGYLTEVTQQVLDYGEPLEPVTIAKYTYNDLWQITEKANHNNIDTTHYGYAIDGRQVSAQSPLFSYKLYFDQKPDNLMYSFFPRYDGNISFMEWQNGVSTRGYRYEYDDVKQLQVGSYGTLTNASWGMGKAYGERNITYDLNGNITTLTRTNSAEENLHDINNTYVGNQLASTNINGVGYAYTYDGDGNMVTDGYKGINIAYNVLNLPSKIFAGSEEVSYIYSASGQKLATKVGDSYTYYRGSFVYNDGELDHMIHPEGLIRKASGGYVYYYAKKDHLGSTRILAYEADGVMQAAQTMDYYPFGLSFRNYGMNFNRYLFSGKELQNQVVNGKALQLYDFGARNYDPVLGRWFNIDPALQFVNPYTYCANNPVMYVDSDGEWIAHANLREWERERMNIQGTIERLESRMDKLEGKGASESRIANLGERISSLNSTINTMGQLETSTQGYGLGKVGADGLGGLSYNNETGIISINYQGTANFVHEVTHAGQFETGEIGLGYSDNVSYGQDVYDEMAAYKAQYAYDPTSVSDLTSSSTVNSFADITTDWVQGVEHNSVRIYNPGTQQNTATFPINMNSTQAEVKKAYPKGFYWGSDTKLFKNMYKMHYKK